VLATVKKIITITTTERTRKARKNTIATIEFDLQKYFAAKQQKYLIIQFAIEKYTTERFCSKANI